MKGFSFHIDNLFFSVLLLIIASAFAFQPLLAQNFITPDIVTYLDEELNESSGLVNLNGEIWTHNDKGGEAKLYQIDINDGSIIRTVVVENAVNIDWEDLTSDEVYVYIGDIGNNDGSRTDLKIYRISRYMLKNYDVVYADIINYSYSDQTSFEPNYHNTDFDCEALISYQNDLYLFTKNWVDYQTKCYKLPNQPGTHVAEYQSTFDVGCLITGAEFNVSPDMLILIGYNLNGGSYTWLFNNFQGSDFFNGNDTKLIWTSLTQIEGICQNIGNSFYISSEKYAGFLEPTLFHLDVSNYLTQITTPDDSKTQIFYHQNVLTFRSISGETFSGEIQILNMAANLVEKYYFSKQRFINIPINLPSGVYLVVLHSNGKVHIEKIMF